MAISSTFAEKEKTVTIKISGSFDFSLHSEFRNCYRYRNEIGIIYFVDLSNAEYMDSSALGMLMLLKEHAEAASGSVILLRPSPKVEKLLTTVKFEKLFEIQN